MGLHRARGVALTVLALVSMCGESLAVVSPATAAASTAPSVSLRHSGAGTVTVSGRTAGAAPKVTFYRATHSGWALVKRVRAHHHRYATRLTVAAGAVVSFKVTANHRSRSFVVRPQTTSTTTATTTAAGPTRYDACGAQPRKADGSAWSCSFDDEFDGTSLDRTKWVPQTAFVTGDATAGYACYVDSTNNVSVAGGSLHLTIRKEPAAVPCGSPTSKVTSVYTAGSISTYHLFSQQYGRFEARVRPAATTATGLHEAFWLWPDDRFPSTVSWPQAGEIDISETYSVSPNLSIPFLHYAADSGGPQPGLNTAWNCTAYRGQWNTYTLVWGPSRLEILVNGRTCLVNTSGDPAFMKPYIVALTAALGQGNNVMTAATPIPATMDVDYLRVWQ